MQVTYDQAARRTNFVHCAHNMLRHRLGINIPAEKLSVIIGDEMDWEWADIDYDPNSPYMDTAPREVVMELVAQHYTGRSWPTYVDYEDMEEFEEALFSAIEEDG
jgi:hypothetical protein